MNSNTNNQLIQFQYQNYLINPNAILYQDIFLDIVILKIHNQNIFLQPNMRQTFSFMGGYDIHSLALKVKYAAT